MGKLAERLADPGRSGVYRVESTEALEEAAALNGFVLHRLVLESPGLPGASPLEDGRILLFVGVEDRGPPDGLLRALEAAAAQCRERRLRYFAVFLDPDALLPLAPLYNWHRR